MPENIYAIVLAAGTSSRFGSSKQLATFRGETLVARACRLAESVCPRRTLLVTGHDALRVHAAAAGCCTAMRVNERYRDGLSSSIATGIGALLHVADAVLVTLADQAAIPAQALEELLVRYRHSGRIVASAYAGTTGPPAVFPAACFDELLALEGDRGAKRLLHGDDVLTVDLPEAALDVDNPEQLAMLDDRAD